MDIGVIGLGVMGENLIMNLLDNNWSVGIYNRTKEKTESFVSKIASDRVKGFTSVSSLVDGLTDRVSNRPRIILLMVKAGQPVDDFLHVLSTLLMPCDVVIDGGNSNYHDTVRRCMEYTGHMQVIGCGISGGEEGARYGPSIMPGGDKEGWASVKSILQSIAAKNSTSGTVCCEWIGPAGSGHLVKTVHNGIEYAEMQIISDFYQIYRKDMTPDKISEIFDGWIKSGTSGFLIETTVDILKRKSEKNNCFIIDSIVDISEQKGTGKWTVLEGYSADSPVPVIGEAVNSRIISSMKEERRTLSNELPVGVLDGRTGLFDILSEDEARMSFLLCRAISYVQGFSLIRRISDLNNWNIDLTVLCRVWSNGCIIRSEFLDTLSKISRNSSFLGSTEFKKISSDGIVPLRKLVSYAISNGISIPCIFSSLSYYDSIRTEKSSGNMIQALRDYFGAHTLLIEGDTAPQHIAWK